MTTTDGDSPLLPLARAEPFALPTGTRDILPAEMAELRELSTVVLDQFRIAGYGEVATPALEFEEVMQRANVDATAVAYSVASEPGKALVARFDSTIPIARLAATRFADVPAPLRFCYMQHVYRVVQPKRGDSREFLQSGLELLGLPAPAGDVEAIVVLCRVLDAIGLNAYKLVLGDARVYERALVAAGVPEEGPERAAIVHELQTRDLVGLRRELGSLAYLSAADRAELIALPTRRGGPELLDHPEAGALRELHRLLDGAGVAENVIYDLGLARRPGYYTGTIIEIYAPGLGFPLGGGGRYDELVGRFGREMTAFGFALNMERVHIAVAEGRS